MNLFNKLDEWVEHSLITSEQKQQISQYESKKNNINSYFTFLAICAFTIGIGCISLVAYNWDEIGKYTKLVASMIILIGCGIGYLYANKSKKSLSELLLIIFYIGILAYIGLIGQIYHLTSEPHHGFLFWGIITSPLLLISKKTFLPFLWFTNITICIGIEFKDFLEIAIKHIGFLGLIGFSFVVIWQGMKRLPKQFNNIIEAFSVCTVIFIILLIWFADGTYSAKEFNTSYLTLFFIPMALLSWFLTPKDERYLYRFVYILFFVFYGITAMGQGVGEHWFMLFDILFMGYLVSFANTTSKKGMARFFTMAIILRIILFYMDLFDNLLTTGIMLIVSGIIAFIFISVWMKFKENLAIKTKRKVS